MRTAPDILRNSLDLALQIFADVRAFAKDKGIPLRLDVEAWIRAEDIEASAGLFPAHLAYRGSPPRAVYSAPLTTGNLHTFSAFNHARAAPTAPLDDDFGGSYGQSMKVIPVPPAAEDLELTVVPKLPLGMGWVAALESRDRGAVLRLESAQQGTISVEIVLTTDGPVIRASVGALEIKAESDVRVSCDRFVVDARESFAVSAGEISHDARRALRATGSEVALTARQGDVVIRANDDVSVHGEQVLLNCDRDPPVPTWLPLSAAVETTLPASSEYGDPEVIRALPQE